MRPSPPTAPTTARARVRRGFTLLEVVLASVIGAAAVLACIGMFAAVDRHSVLGRDRFDEALELERTHEAVARAMQLLIMSDSPMPSTPAQGDAGRRGQQNSGDAASSETTTDEPPRFKLAYDPSLAIEMIDSEGTVARPQRFEVVLLAQPIFVASGAADDLAKDDRPRSRRELREQRRADEEALTSLVEEDVTIAPGVRGVFELTFHPGPSPIPGMDGTFSLWWRRLDVSGDEWSGLPAGGDGSGIGRALLMSNLTFCRWTVFSKGELREEHTATWSEELPAYVFLRTETALGTFHEWLFELAWSTGKEPGTETRTPVEDAQSAENNAGNAGAQNQPAGNNNASGRNNNATDPQRSRPGSSNSSRSSTPARRTGGDAGRPSSTGGRPR